MYRPPVVGNTPRKPAEQGADAVFRLCNADKVYRMGESEIHALRGVDLELLPGDVVVVLGASGRGQSTLPNILGGLGRPTSGEVRYRDHDLTAAPPAELTRFRRGHVGVVFQFDNRIPGLTVYENVALVTTMQCARARARAGTKAATCEP